MKQPVRLKKGDTVGVVAPAGVVDPEILEKGLGSLKRMGFFPVVAGHVCSRDRYFAGTDK